MQVHDEAGAAWTLGEALGRGGEGEVSTVVEDPTLVAKILHPERRRKSKHEKLRAMLQRPPQGAYDSVDGFPVLAWPRSLLYSSRRPGDDTFIGYTMTRIQPRDFVPLYQITTAKRRERLGGEPVTWDRLLLLGARLCHVVRTLHRFGYAVGDLNDRNILVSRRFTPLLMDTDSFQVPRRIGHFPSMVGDQLYWPPELLGVDLSTHRKSRVDGDRYALATILFQLFMDGNRPYQARGSAVEGFETLMEKTRAGLFPWAEPVPGVLEPPSGAPSFAALPPSIAHGFVRCFVDGHKDPRRRPTADWWHRELAKLVQAGFQACTTDARHVYGADAAACPWCDAARDPFRPAARTRPAARRRKSPTRTPAGGKAASPGHAGAKASASTKKTTHKKHASQAKKTGTAGRTTAATAKKPTTKAPARQAAKGTGSAKGSTATPSAKGPGAAKKSTTRSAGKGTGAGKGARPAAKSSGGRATTKAKAGAAAQRSTGAAGKPPSNRTKNTTRAASSTAQKGKGRSRAKGRGATASAPPGPRRTRRPQAKGASTKRNTVDVSAPNVAARLVGPAWAMAVLLALLAPMLWLWRPGGIEKHVVAAALTIAAASVPAVAWAWHSRDRLRRAGVACVWIVGAAWAVGALAASGAWRGLEAAAGAACLVAAGMVFVTLERRQGPMRGLHARSLLHALAGLPIAYLPLLAWGAWRFVT